jgi:hypothetical protein
MEKIGIDIGRVIIGGDAGGGDTPFLGVPDDVAMAAPAVADAFSVIAELVERSGGAVWLVSKCGSGVQRRTLRWLRERGFHERTRVDESRVLFCRERREKAIIAERLGLTHFIDDRADVLEAMAGIVEHRMLFGPQAAPPRADAALIHVPDWQAVRRLLIGDQGISRYDAGT